MLNSHTKNTDFILIILPSVINLITPLYSTQFMVIDHMIYMFLAPQSSVIYDKRSLDFQHSLEVEYDFWLSLEMECAVFYFQAKMNWTLNVVRLLNEPKPSRED
ncbi:hypothetical protein RhiirA1_543293 [Rhizophagus irregularis]|uniref:Uncharacterized protein n=1 Tax=Rhizophagus irregularis TaxID=588596 RepID=A0A2N0QQ04_9GLOM|nr:hypothetical protein RhiirA1_543293 [Rhizophagus irregularis]